MWGAGFLPYGADDLARIVDYGNGFLEAGRHGIGLGARGKLKLARTGNLISELTRVLVQVLSGVLCSPGKGDLSCRKKDSKLPSMPGR